MAPLQGSQLLVSCALHGHCQPVAKKAEKLPSTSRWQRALVLVKQWHPLHGMDWLLKCCADVVHEKLYHCRVHRHGSRQSDIVCTEILQISPLECGVSASPRGSFGSREVIVLCFDAFPVCPVLTSCPLGLAPAVLSQLLSSDASMASDTSS